MSTTNTLGKTKQRKKSKMCEMSADKVLQAIEDAKTGPDAFECVRHYARVKQHYDHARKKHPYFCDRLLWNDAPVWTAGTLRVARNDLNNAIKSNDVSAIDHVLDCELHKLEDALAHGDKAHAVEECYDIAVVALRIADVLEGRQKLGKPEDAK